MSDEALAREMLRSLGHFWPFFLVLAMPVLLAGMMWIKKQRTGGNRKPYDPNR
jgi:hypothetical protein